MSLPYRYYDVRRVTGEVTQIDVDNGRVEQAGSSFFDKAVIRVLGEKGWGILSVSGEEAEFETLPESFTSGSRRSITGYDHPYPAIRRHLPSSSCPCGDSKTG